MFEIYKLEESKMNVNFTQMYDYAKLGFSFGSPYLWDFDISLSENDIDLIILKLKEMKKELKNKLEKKE